MVSSVGVFLRKMVAEIEVGSSIAFVLDGLVSAEKSSSMEKRARTEELKSCRGNASGSNCVDGGGGVQKQRLADIEFLFLGVH